MSAKHTLAKLFTEQFSFAASDSIVVIGLGRFGGAVAESLIDLGHDVMGIDAEEGPVQAWSHRLTHAVQADCTNAQVLRQLGVADFAHAVVGIGDDLAASLMAVLALVELKVKDIWVKATAPEHGHIAERIGAHHVIYPEADMGRRVARLITGRMMDYIEIDEGFAVAKVLAPEAAVRDGLARPDIRDRFGVTLVGLKRPSQAFEHATPETRVRTGDVVVVAGPARLVEKFAGDVRK